MLDQPIAPVRLIAADLDGTLLRGDNTISGRTRAVLRSLSEAGVLVVLVTARPPGFVRQLTSEAGIEGLAICANGALVYDLAADRILERHAISIEVTHQLIVALRGAIPSVCFAIGMGTNYAWDHAYALLEGMMDSVDVVGVDDDILILCTEPVTKLIVRHPTWTADELLSEVRAVVGDAAHATHSGAAFVELSAPGVQKAAALAALCEGIDVTAEQVVAFGDMPNDIPLLHWAGWGVAVANAHPEVLAEADEVTLSNEEDGVALVLERVLNIT
jgi:hypothetical protein